MDDVIGNYGGRLIVAIAGVGIALVGFYVVMRFIRSRGGSLPFLRQNRGRDTRLQVLDTTAIDARRRLVLVRRDNVEHLIMIGGPTDVVIESRIIAEGDADYDDTGFIENDYLHDVEEEDGTEEEAAAPYPETPRPAMSPAQAWRSLAEARVPQERPAQPPPLPAEPAPSEPARMPYKPATVVAPQPAARTTPRAAAITEQMNDFEKMLEAEMAARLEAGRNRPQSGSTQAGKRQPASAPPTAQAARPPAGNAAPAQSVDQKAMQRQMARIFGDDNV